MTDKKNPNKGTYREDEIVDQHPAFGMVQFNHVSSNSQRLFGSSLTNHMNTVRLRIHTNVKRIHNHGSEHYYCPNQPEIEVELSAAQFSELLTTMNVGFGVPCTVQYVRGKSVEALPEMEMENDRIKNDFAKVFTKAVEELKTERDTVLNSIDGKVTKKVYAEIEHSFSMAMMAIEKNAPYYLERFEEATEKTLKTAKAEADAFMTRAIHRAGIKALQEGEEGANQKVLPESKEKP